MCGCEPSTAQKPETELPKGEHTAQQASSTTLNAGKVVPPQEQSNKAQEVATIPPKRPPEATSSPPAKTATEPSEGIVKAIFDEQNLARTNPKAYASKLEKYLGYFKGTTLYFPGNPIGLMTNEGTPAYKEAIAFLNGQESLPPLKWSAGLAKAANDHAKDIGSQGLTGHTGSEGSSMKDRMNRYGKCQSKCGENCSFGPNTPEETICQLIVDDGVSSRNHRKNIFSPDFEVTGIAVAPHESMNNCCVFDYAKNYVEAYCSASFRQYTVFLLALSIIGICLLCYIDSCCS